MSNRTVGVAKLSRHGLTGKEWSRDPVPTGCFEHGVSMTLTTPTPFLLEMSSPCAPPPGRMRVATVSTPSGSSVSAGTEKSLILLRRFYTRSAAAGSKYCLVKVSPASVRGMSIGDDPTARR